MSGLCNLGNTCYLNSVVQCLCHTTELIDVLHSDEMDNLKKCEMGKLTKEIIGLMDLMLSGSNIISPKRFWKYFTSACQIKDMSYLSSYEQCDAGETLQFIIECLHNSLSRQVTMKIQGNAISNRDVIAKTCLEAHKRFFEREYSKIVEVFSGLKFDTINYSKPGKKVSRICEPFTNLVLPIVNKINTHSSTLYDCFDEFGKNEQLESCSKYTRFWSFPDVLVITIARFNNQGTKKNNALVNFPICSLDLGKYCIGYNKNNIYDLYGTCNHNGSIQGGHYTSRCKIKRKWYCFNDTSVDEIKEEKIISSSVYILFYRRKEL
uniref:USP domain-containing protein n=1 Tax=viral metagenome TaxID=1070528 RepID=A0A6C0JBN9_9ZZZZ